MMRISSWTKFTGSSKVDVTEANGVLQELNLKFNGIQEPAAKRILDATSKSMKCYVDLTSRFGEEFNEVFFRTMKKIKGKRGKKKKKKKAK